MPRLLLNSEHCLEKSQNKKQKQKAPKKNHPRRQPCNIYKMFMNISESCKMTSNPRYFWSKNTP